MLEDTEMKYRATLIHMHFITFVLGIFNNYSGVTQKHNYSVVGRSYT